jgi:membrane associated rhomboid family serine protease
MGLYDRDYERQRPYGHQPGFNIQAPTTITVKLIIVTCAVYLTQLFSDNWVTNFCALPDSWYREPWQAYRLITYGFIHSPESLGHILFNMFSFWLFGREVEYKYGSREFLAFYLVAIVFAGLVWTLAELPMESRAVMYGASGGVAAVLILFALNFPHREILFMFLFPMPMWVLAIIMVAYDVFGAMQRSDNVAFTAHLGGAAFAFVYYQWGWRLGSLLPGAGLWKRLKPKPKLRVVDADESDADSDADTARLDAILKKISEKGEDSLTYGERRFLQRTSKEYQDKRRP